MPSVLVAAAAGGGRFIPTKPDLVWTNYGQINISNFSTNLSYSISVNNGSVSTSSSLISLSSINAILTVTSSSPKGGTSQASTFERRSYTFSTTSSTSCSPNCRIAAFINGQWTCQGDGSPGADGTICCGGSAGQTCTTTNTTVRNATPSGFIDQYGEWGRIL